MYTVICFFIFQLIHVCFHSGPNAAPLAVCRVSIATERGKYARHVYMSPDLKKIKIKILSENITQVVCSAALTSFNKRDAPVSSVSVVSSATVERLTELTMLTELTAKQKHVVLDRSESELRVEQ